MVSEDRNDLLQQYLEAVASYLEAQADNGDSQPIEELLDQAQRAFRSLEEPDR